MTGLLSSSSLSRGPDYVRRAFLLYRAALIEKAVRSGLAGNRRLVWPGPRTPFMG